MRRRLRISFSVSHAVVKVITPTCQAKAANSTAVKCFCCVTCLCIIGWPLLAAMRDLDLKLAEAELGTSALQYLFQHTRAFIQAHGDTSAYKWDL